MLNFDFCLMSRERGFLYSWLRRSLRVHQLVLWLMSPFKLTQGIQYLFMVWTFIYIYIMFVSVMFLFCLIDVGAMRTDHNVFLFCYSILISAFVGTGLAFACFSVAAMVARRREYLYLGGLLSSGLSMLLWLHFASSIFGGSTAIFKFEVRGC